MSVVGDQEIGGPTGITVLVLSHLLWRECRSRRPGLACRIKVLNSKSKLLNENIIQFGATKLCTEGYTDSFFA